MSNMSVHFLFTSFLVASLVHSTPKHNLNKIKIEVDADCITGTCEDFKQALFKEYKGCLYPTSRNEVFEVKNTCMIYASLRSDHKDDVKAVKTSDSFDNQCFASLKDYKCVTMFEYEPIMEVNSVSYENDACLLQDLKLKEPCFPIYYEPYNYQHLDGSICSRAVDIETDDGTVPILYHLRQWSLAPENVYDRSFMYPDTRETGQNIDIWILDSGVDATHVEFEGLEIIKTGGGWYGPGTYAYHGTSVASSAVGNYAGVSKNFRIFDCATCYIDTGVSTGCTDEAIFGCLNTVKKYYRKNSGRRGIINMSFGGGATFQRELDYNNAFSELIDLGAIPVTSAGNSYDNALYYVPANSPYAITAGATDWNGNIAYFSNYGDTVDVFAPGHLVLTALDSAETPNNNKNFYTFISGTSFSSPIVAGEIANILSRDNSLTFDQIKQILASRVIGEAGGCPSTSCPRVTGFCNFTGVAQEVSLDPTMMPSTFPTQFPSNLPTTTPISAPTGMPSGSPIGSPTGLPTGAPTDKNKDSSSKHGGGNGKGKGRGSSSSRRRDSWD